MIGPREWWEYTDSVLKIAAAVRNSGKRRRPRKSKTKPEPEPKAHTLLAFMVRREKCAFALQVPRVVGGPRIVVGRIVEGMTDGKQRSLRAGIVDLPDDCVVVGMVVEEGSRYTYDHHAEVRAQMDGVAKLVDLPRPPKGSHLVGLGVYGGGSTADEGAVDLVERANELADLNLSPEQRLEAKAIGLLLYARDTCFRPPRRSRPMSARRELRMAVDLARAKINGWDLRRLREGGLAE